MENLTAYIEVNPEIMMGKPVIKGTRITVELIVEALAAGRSIEDLLGSYPSLTKEAILAALQYAANNLRADYIYPIAS
jgi:uncharacterized protein (DUF433 family)